MGIVNAQQVEADAYEKLDKELLSFVEDVLLNLCAPQWLYLCRHVSCGPESHRAEQSKPFLAYVYILRSIGEYPQAPQLLDLKDHVGISQRGIDLLRNLELEIDDSGFCKRKHRA